MAAKAGETEREFSDKHGIFEKSSRQRLRTPNSGSHIVNNANFSSAADEKLEQQDNVDAAEEEASEQLEDSEVDRDAKEEAVQ